MNIDQCACACTTKRYWDALRIRQSRYVVVIKDLLDMMLRVFIAFLLGLYEDSFIFIYFLNVFLNKTVHGPASLRALQDPKN